MSFACLCAFPTQRSLFSVATLAIAFVLCSSTPGFVLTAHAQVTTAITSSGLGTTINQSGAVYNITGGTRPGVGTNLFHSFGLFSVGAGDTANFFNDSGLFTTNILGRVTGGNPSNIFGTIQTTGFGNANLFLMNPAGIIFGPNATLNVGGSVNFTTADYLRLGDGQLFNAVPNATVDALLSAAPVTAFGFLGSNPGAITVQGSQLSVPSGQGIALIGGNIEIKAGTLDNAMTQAAKLSAPAGQINIVSVASPGEVQLSNFQPEANMTLGAITLSEGATLDVSAVAAGTVRIRGGQFVIADGTISADTGDINGTPVAVDINISGDLSITDALGSPAITARTFGAGDAGEIRIASANFQATSTVPVLTGFVLIDSHSSGDGRGGNVNITAGNLNVIGPAPTFVFIDSGPEGTGRGGDVTITAQRIQFDGTTISTGTQLAEIRGLEVTGPAGNLTIIADSLQMSESGVALLTTATAALAETQLAGDVTVNVHDIKMINGSISAIGVQGGAITINTDKLVTDFTTFETDSVLLPGRGITVNARVVELTNGSSLISSAFGDGKAGDIHVTASDHVSLVGVTGPNPQGVFRPSGLFSNSFGDFGTQGDAGNIVVTTPRLEMTQGRINTSTATSGHGGNVTINASAISISGEFPNPDFVPEPIFNITDIHPSGIFTKTVGIDNCSGPCGDAGRIAITTGSLTMGNGSQIDSGTSSTGQGGAITIHATGSVSLSGTLSDGTPSGIFSRTIGADPGSGSGGSIALQARQMTISNRSSVSASSTGAGNAGNIQLTASDSLAMQNQASISTATTQSDGGDIHIQAGQLVQLTGSTITTSVQGGTGNGGNITIDPQFVILQSSQVIANAFGGNGGNINIVAGTFFADPLSVVSASSNLGVSGTVNIQAPVTALSGTLAPLPGEIVQAAALLRAACATRFQGGNLSSFVVAGREGVPLEPGGFLPSPLFIEAVGGRLTGSSNLPSLRVGGLLGESAQALATLDAGCGS